MLKPVHLARLAESFLEMIVIIREIDISYNLLNFSHPGSKEHTHSEAFVVKLVELMENSRLLNHMNLSGMHLSHDAVVSFSKAIIKSRLMMAIHLSDNGITENYNRLLSVLKIYGLTEADIPIQRQGDKLHEETMKTIKPRTQEKIDRESTYCQKVMNYFKN